MLSRNNKATVTNGTGASMEMPMSRVALTPEDMPMGGKVSVNSAPKPASDVPPHLYRAKSIDC